MCELFIQAEGRGATYNELIEKAKTAAVEILYCNRREMDKMAAGSVHQGVIAEYMPPVLISLEEFLEGTGAGKRTPLVILDGVEDPRNLGAIIRSTEILGGAAVIIRNRRAAGLTPSAVKASAGAALILPLIGVANINAAMRTLKKDGYWIYGLDPQGGNTIWETDLSDKICLVAGAEGKGLSRLTRERCDGLARIPQEGKIASLNVSVTVSLALGEWLRQSRIKRS